MSNLAEKITQEQQLEQQALTLADKALAITVTDDVSLGLAGEFTKSIREMKKGIVEFFGPMKKSAHETWKGIVAKENEAIKPLDEADAAIRKTMNAYLTEQDRIRREQERKARIAAEEVARKEQEKLLAQAAKAEEKGQVGKAEVLLEKAEDVYVEPVAVAHRAPVKTEAATTGTAKDLTVEISNMKEFIAELLAQNSNAFDALFTVKPSALKAWAKSNGVKRFKGLHIEEVVSARIR